MDIIYFYRAFHTKTSDYTLFFSAHGTFSRIDHILAHKTRLSKFKKVEVILSIFSNHSFEIINQLQRKVKKYTNLWRLNNILLKYDLAKGEMKDNIKRYNETNKNDNNAYQIF